jgi:hypothetical protein
LQVGLQFVRNPLLQTPLSLYKSCRGLKDLQLCLLAPCAL